MRRSSVHAALPPLLSIFLFVLLFLAVLPKTTLIKSDDFAYLLSVVESIWRGRIVTADWLAPYGASNTLASVLAYGITGNFYLSTYGLLVVYAALFCALLYAVLRRSMDTARCWRWTLLVAACPLLFAKLSDFTPSAQSWVLFLLAMLLFYGGRPIWFAIVAILLFANRQVSLCLAVLPLAQAGLAFLKSGRIDRASAGCAAAIVAGCVAVHAAIPDNFARREVMGSLYQHDPVFYAKALALYLFILVASFTIACFGIGGSALLERRPPKAQVLVWAAGAAILIYVYFFRDDPFRFATGALLFETPLPNFMPVSAVIKALIIGLVAVTYAAPMRAMLRAPELYAAIAIALVSALNRNVWDYYVVEIGLLGLFCGLRHASAQAGPAWTLTDARVGRVLCAVYIAGCALWIVYFKLFLIKTETEVTIQERLLRAGLMSVSEIPPRLEAYCQYKLYDFAAGRYLQSRPLGGALPNCKQYVNGAVVIEFDSSIKPLRAKAIDPDCVPFATPPEFIEGTAAIRYRALRCPAPPPLLQVPAGYRARLFPLSNVEWAAFIGRGPD